MQGFAQLKVWQRAHLLTLSVYKNTRPFPKEELYGLTSQMRRASASVPANIAEGCGSSSSADFGWFLQMAMRSASEPHYHLILARDLAYLADSHYERLMVEVIGVKRMLSSLIRRVKPKVFVSAGAQPQMQNRSLITNN